MLTFSASDDESNRNHVNSDVTNLSDNESDSKLESDHELESDQELESDPEHKSDQETESEEGLESDPKANCISADSSFDGNTSTKIDYRNFRLEPYVEEFPWLYYNVLEKGYKCKNCELFPVVGSGNAAHKFGSEAVKSLTDHPRRLLQRHAESKKHQNASKEYEGMYNHNTNDL